MSITRSIDKSLKLLELEDEMRFLEEGGYVTKSLVATTNTTDNTEFNVVVLDERTTTLSGPLELITAASPQALDLLAQEKIDQGYEVIFLSDEVFVESKRVPVGAVRTADVPGSLSWDANHPERKDWSVQLISSIGQYKAQLDQGNPNTFINGYNTLSPGLQIKFWAELIIAVAKFESNWDPHNIFHEPPPLGVDSVGLLQLSYEDEPVYHLEHLNRVNKDLENPLINIRCGLKIFAFLLARDRTVTRKVNDSFRGAAAYWSVIREGTSHHLLEIVALTKHNVGL